MEVQQKGNYFSFKLFLKNIFENKTRLSKFKYVPNIRLLICGGDGSAGWVMSVMDTIFSNEQLPPIGILPLGTGNDLSRTLSEKQFFFCIEK